MGEADLTEQPTGWWPQVRAALIAAHMLAITLMALPSPGEGMVREAWQDPTVQGEFAIWTERCNRLGIQVTQQQFEDRLWEIASAYTNAHNRVLRPFGPYYDYCGTVQSWRMFAGPQRYPGRLHIDVLEGGAWRTLFVQRDPAYAWLVPCLDHYRMRPEIYRFSWPHYLGDFHQFAEWVARQAAREFPDAEQVRVSLVRERTRSPEEVRAGRPIEQLPGPEAVLDLGGWR